MNATVKAVAEHIVGRAESQRWPSRAATNHALDFALGAYAALNTIDHPDAPAMGIFCMLLASRGYSHITETLAKEPTP